MDDFDVEIKQGFLTEAAELLTGAERCFLDLERGVDAGETLNTIFRLAHNLKGSSRAVGFDELAEFTHKLETLLLALKEGRLAATPPIVDLLLRSNDYLSRVIALLQTDVAATYVNTELSEELVRALTDPSYRVATRASEVDASAGSAPAEAEVEPEASEIVIPLATVAATAPTAATAPKADENIRVSLGRIEQLLNNVGELSILQAVMVQQSAERGTMISPLMRETLSAMSKIVRDTQSLSMGLRMMPIRQTFQKMQRIVRDTSKALGKDVELILSGEDTEIDKTVLEKLGDPLVHIIRNAVDHGVEDTATRLSVGKSGVGTVHLSASHRAGHVVIEVREDGRGLDPAKLIERAKARGVIAANAELTPEQAYQLVFAPGFSTKDVVTDVSGRGVGMDVVKTNVTALQGRIEIETVLGQGTTFRIILPLTLAIIDSIVVDVKGHRYVVPLNQVSEFYKPREVDVTRAYGRDPILNVRGETMALFGLSQVMGQRGEPGEVDFGATALIVRESDRTFAVTVDRVIAQQQVVIKPLGPELKNRAGLMGSAILGDGRPALILDLIELNSKLRPPTKAGANRPAEMA